MTNEAHTDTPRIAIVGGGAAGLAAGVAAATHARDLGYALDIAVYEADAKVGRPILRSGNGRCNFSNAQVSAGEYSQLAGGSSAQASASDEHARFASRAMDALPPQQVWDFFDGLGLAWVREGQGRLYPSTGKASTVLDVLRRQLRILGARERCGSAVAAIEAPSERAKCWTLRMADGAFNRAEAVIACIGGHDGTACLPAAIPRSDFTPVLGPLATDAQLVRTLDNIRVHAALSLVDAQGAEIAHEAGELLFRKYGVSGIAVFNLSRFAMPGCTLLVNLLPSCPDVPALLAERLRRACDQDPCATVEDAFCGLLLPLVAQAVCKCAHIDPHLRADTLNGAQRKALANALTALPLPVKGIAQPEIAQVSRGGIRLSAVDPATMAVTAPGHAGLFAAGELLDIDAPCGGYNLHWAWTSGILAGRAAATLAARA